ncbi:coatomer subunit beta'-2-like [Chenopodium quinoa]|uniref:coatomer subunit beta'-2-like n=1 Tax=Chenopodium quinoa TaxID=63459 RepID=UPI000B76E7E4|nr:coatomer subunit beta'-2-like [Chenopodium quinoa]
MNSRLISLKNLLELSHWTFIQCSHVRSAKFVAQKDWIITGSDDKMIRVYDYKTEEKVKEFVAHNDYVRHIVVHPTLPYVLTASDDKQIKLWDWEDWVCTRTFLGHSHYVMQVAINPIDHNNFVSVSLDGSIKIWNLDNPNPITSVAAHNTGVNCVAYYLTSDNKLYILTGSDDFTTKVWNYENMNCVEVLKGHTNNVSMALVHPNLPLIFTGSEDKTIHIWNAITYKLEKTLDQGLGRVWVLKYDKISNKIVIGCDEGFLVGKFGP